jgi:hypothetical protein
MKKRKEKESNRDFCLFANQRIIDAEFFFLGLLYLFCSAQID